MFVCSEHLTIIKHESTSRLPRAPNSFNDATSELPGTPDRSCLVESQKDVSDLRVTDRPPLKILVQDRSIWCQTEAAASALPFPILSRKHRSLSVYVDETRPPGLAIQSHAKTLLSHQELHLGIGEGEPTEGAWHGPPEAVRGSEDVPGDFATVLSIEAGREGLVAEFGEPGATVLLLEALCNVSVRRAAEALGPVGSKLNGQTVEELVLLGASAAVVDDGQIGEIHPVRIGRGVTRCSARLGRTALRPAPACRCLLCSRLSAGELASRDHLRPHGAGEGAEVGPPLRARLLASLVASAAKEIGGMDLDHCATP